MTNLKHIIRAGRGIIPAHTVVLNGNLVNVMTSEIYKADVAIYDETIVAVGDVSDYIGEDTQTIDAAGDNYSIREAQFADGICTMISAMLGGVVPNTVWLGHAGLKKSGAGIGLSYALR